MADRPVTRQDLIGAAVVVLVLLAFAVFHSLAPREWQGPLAALLMAAMWLLALVLLRRARRRREQSAEPHEAPPTNPIEPG